MSIQTILQKLSPIRDYISNLRTKKSFIYLAIVIIAFLLVLALVWHFAQMPPVPPEVFLPLPERPLEEIYPLPEPGIQPYPGEEILRQLEELERLRPQ